MRNAWSYFGRVSFTSCPYFCACNLRPKCECVFLFLFIFCSDTQWIARISLEQNILNSKAHCTVSRKKIQWARIEDEYKHMLSVRGLGSNLSNNRITVAYSHQPNDWLNIFSLMWTLQPVQWVGSQLQWCFTKLFNRIHQKTEVEKKNSIRLNNLWLFINKSTNAK